jgi:hypothetical protein
MYDSSHKLRGIPDSSELTKTDTAGNSARLQSLRIKIDVRTVGCNMVLQFKNRKCDGNNVWKKARSLSPFKMSNTD